MNPTIEIPNQPYGLTRQVNDPNFRERHEEEKYYLQSIHIFDETGKQIDSGFVKLNDYTKGCSMVRILNKFEKHLHIFKCWEYYGDKYFETEKYKIMDLATNRCCNDYHTYKEIETGLIDCNLWGLVRCPHKTETMAESRTPFYGDIERDVYSEALLECLEPANNLETNNLESEDKFCCRLEEILNIEDACKTAQLGCGHKFCGNCICEVAKATTKSFILCALCRDEITEIKVSDEDTKKQLELYIE